jgi:hypothetical protein
MRWRVILPVIGLLLFAGETYQSVRMNRAGQHSPSRYFWWSSIRMDSDPLNRRPRVAAPCEEGVENCVTWDLRSIYVDPGWLTLSLMLTALPAFAVGKLIVAGLGRFGINQIWSFMILMPVFLSAWYFFLGWLVDRWKYMRQHPS